MAKHNRSTSTLTADALAAIVATAVTEALAALVGDQTAPAKPKPAKKAAAKKAVAKKAAKKPTPDFIVRRGENKAANLELAEYLRARGINPAGAAWAAAKAGERDLVTLTKLAKADEAALGVESEAAEVAEAGASLTPAQKGAQTKARKAQLREAGLTEAQITAALKIAG
jgi:hypothetical protein